MAAQLAQPAQLNQPLPPLTEFARKYGVSKFSTFQSGLTPNDPSFPSLLQPSPLPNEAYQRRGLYGFTTEELARKDCLPIRELKPGNLQNGIIDVLKRENWEKSARKPRFTYHSRTSLYKMKNGKGYWTMVNDEAWNVMVPCLKLASRMIMSAHTIPWVCYPTVRLPLSLHLNSLRVVVRNRTSSGMCCMAEMVVFFCFPSCGRKLIKV